METSRRLSTQQKAEFRVSRLMEGIAVALFGMILLHTTPSYAASGSTFNVVGRVHIKASALDEAQEGQECTNVVAYLEPAGDIKLPITVDSMPKKIDQVDKKFDPEILTVTRGSVVHFPNQDHIFHNVFSLSKTKPFDLGAFGHGKDGSVTFEKPGLVVNYCNIHPDMISYILIFENDYFKRLGPDCRFDFSNLPEGKYLLKAWYRYGEGAAVEIDSSSKTDLAVEMNLKKTFKKELSVEKTKTNFKHLNKWGKPYLNKY